MDKILHGSDTDKIYFRYKNDFGRVQEGYIPFEGVLKNIERRYQGDEFRLYS